MTTIPEKRIDAIIERHAALQARMATGDMAPADFVAASKEFAKLEPVAAAAREVVRLRGERTALTEMLADPEMKAMAEEELEAVAAALPAAEHAPNGRASCRERVCPYVQITVAAVSLIKQIEVTQRTTLWSEHNALTFLSI